jgi:hypothetical protein
LQELQELELQEDEEHDDEVGFLTPLIPKTENFFSTLFESHFGHSIF